MEPEQLAGFDDRIRRTFTETFSSLKHRNFRLYFTGQIISNTGNWLTNVAITLFVLNLTHSGFAVGVLAACQYGPILLLTIYGGAVADRTDKRKMLIVTQCLEMAQSVGLAAFAFIPHPPLIALYILAALGGIFLAFDNPLRRSFVSEMVPGEDVANAVVIYSTIVNLSRIFGPLLAGFLIVTVGYGWCFTVDALSYIAALLALVRMNPRELIRSKRTPSATGEVRAGLRYVFKQPVIWISFLMLLIIGILSYNFTVTLPLFVTSSLHAGNTTFTAIYSVMSIGSVVTALIVARRKLVKFQHSVIGAIALGISTILLGIAPDAMTAAIVSFFIGAASILYTTSTTALAQMATRADMRGRVLAIQAVLLIGTTPIGGPILGLLADHAGARAPLILGGVASLVAACAGYSISRFYHGKIVREI